jgi:hypothetical protein
MQNQVVLEQLQIAPADCELGMILINAEDPEQRWQGSAAAEEIGRLLPGGQAFVALYRSIPGVKPVGDRFYEQVRDNRYQLFGQRQSTYYSNYPSGMSSASDAANPPEDTNPPDAANPPDTPDTKRCQDFNLSGLEADSACSNCHL